MGSNDLVTLAAAGFVVAFFHAALPTHWLPFVLVAQARGWTRAKTLSVTVFSGLGHVALTTLLGAGIAWFGIILDARFGQVFPWLVGGLFLLIGAYYFWRQATGRGICHHHLPGTHRASEECGHEHARSHWEHELEDSPVASRSAADWTAISGLFAMLTFSPCEVFLPVYLRSAPYGWRGFTVLSAILAAATLLGMVVFISLAFVGVDRLKLKRFERREAALMGALFTLLGVVVIAVGN